MSNWAERRTESGPKSGRDLIRTWRTDGRPESFRVAETPRTRTLAASVCETIRGMQRNLKWQQGTASDLIENLPGSQGRTGGDRARPRHRFFLKMSLLQLQSTLHPQTTLLLSEISCDAIAIFTFFDFNFNVSNSDICSMISLMRYLLLKRAARLKEVHLYIINKSHTISY